MEEKERRTGLHAIVLGIFAFFFVAFCYDGGDAAAGLRVVSGGNELRIDGGVPRSEGRTW